MAFLKSHIAKLPAFTLLTGISLAIGLLIPTVFEWGEKQAVRSRYPEMEIAALGSLLVSFVFAAILWRLTKPTRPEDTTESESTNPVQFGIRHVLIVTTFVAALFAIAPVLTLLTLPDSVLHWVMMTVLIGVVAWSVFQERRIRSSMGATLACLFLPFAWIVPTSVPFGHTSGLLPAILYGPGLMPAILLRRGAGNDLMMLAFLFVILELAIAIWLARRGGKLALAYTLFALCFSSVTSFGFHALYRM